MITIGNDKNGVKRITKNLESAFYKMMNFRGLRMKNTSKEEILKANDGWDVIGPKMNQEPI